MFYLRIVLVISTLLPSRALPGQQQRDSVLYRIISVNADNLPVTVILDKITKDNGIFFSYDALLINNEKRITVHLNNRSVIEILQIIFKNEPFGFIGKNNHVIISDREDLFVVPNPPPDSLSPPPIIVLTGRILDNSNLEPISQVSVSLLNQPVGTITNNDGNFILKLPAENKNDTLLISCLGFASQKKVIRDFRSDEVISLHPVSIKIREIKVRAISAQEILTNFRKNINENYSTEYQMLTGFYRETLKQDDEYINVSEAVLEILKASYDQVTRDDKIHLLKARRSPEIRPFHWVNFKLQGGPHTITMLDIVKNLETFLDPEYDLFYHFTVQQVIRYNNRPAFVIRFKPVKDIQIPCFVGEMYIDRENYALMYARFSLDEFGLEYTGQSFIIKKPKGFRVKPLYVDYQIDFSEYNALWHLHSAQASIAFRVKSRKDNVNSVFQSVSDLLITDVKNTDLKRFPVKDLFSANDIFTEFATDYDESFWADYNIIKPDENLQAAIKKFVPSQNQDHPEGNSK
jgi:hypothetical protein